MLLFLQIAKIYSSKAVLDNDWISKRFLNVINLQHLYLKFTVEKATESFSNYFEIKIFDKGFEHSVYRKQSNTSIILNYHANCPKS